jgi:O-antigen biosynthesis protein
MKIKPPQNIKLNYYPLVTVAICTRDRSQSLERALPSLVQLNYPNFEIIVVDNAPTTNQTALLVKAMMQKYRHLRYVLESRPGLNWARNRALQEAQGEIIAYTDDDIVADPLWLLTLVQSFQGFSAACVAGSVLPFEMETRAQFLFEAYGGFCRSLSRHIYDRSAQVGIHYPLSAHHFGTGANMAFRVDVLRKLGGFDNALDVGTPTNGGGDLEIFFRIVKEGYTLVYEPNALVWHIHRREYDALKRQLQNNGTAYYAYLTRTFIHYPDERLRVITFGIWWWFYWNVRRLFKKLFEHDNFPLDLILAETLAVFQGPFAYLKARKLARQIANGKYDQNHSLWLDSELTSQR